MEISNKLIGQLFPIVKLPNKKGIDLTIGQFYEVVSVKTRTLTIKDDSGNEVSIYPSALNMEFSFEYKESKKQKFEDENLGFDWLDDNLEIVLPEEYNKTTEDDDLREMGWLIKADAFSKGAEMEKAQFELMIDFLKRKNKIKEYQSIMVEVERRENSRMNVLDELLS